MVAGIVAAWKAASPLIKYGSIAALVVMLMSGYVLWREHQRSIGEQQEEVRQVRDLLKQAQAAKEETARERQRALESVSELIRVKADLGEQLEAVRKDRARYAKQKTISCPVDAESVRIVNEFARVLNDVSSPHERLPDAGAAPTGTALEAEAPITAVDSSVYLERIDELTKRNAVTEAEHRELSEYAVNKYHADLRFYLGQQAGYERE